MRLTNRWNLWQIVGIVFLIVGVNLLTMLAYYYTNDYHLSQDYEDITLVHVTILILIGTILILIGIVKQFIKDKHRRICPDCRKFIPFDAVCCPYCKKDLEG